MLHTAVLSAQHARVPPNDGGDSDYLLVRRAIEFLAECWQEQPDLKMLADHIGLSPAHCQKLFKRWCGLSPKEFLQAITIDRARELLGDSNNLLQTAFDVGLSGTGRLHDLFVDHEAMTPGDYKRRGAGLDIFYGFHQSPFGLSLLMATERGVCGLAFADNEKGQSEILDDMIARWPAANFRLDEQVTFHHALQVFQPGKWRKDKPIRLVLIGSDFEVKVWETLLKIPMGRMVTYTDVAERIGRPSASRAVGTAIGRNPISFVVPCHRVVRKDGGLGGYHWGITRKRAIIGWEKGQVG